MRLMVPSTSKVLILNIAAANRAKFMRVGDPTIHWRASSSCPATVGGVRFLSRPGVQCG